jgi:hypothetical protein
LPERRDQVRLMAFVGLRRRQAAFAVFRTLRGAPAARSGWRHPSS